MFKTISKEVNSLSSVVFNALKKAIFSGQLKPGQRLVESSLAAQFGVSSIPLREAIKKLEAEKLVEVIPYKGAHVAKASPQDIEYMYTIVGVLEGYAAKLVTPMLKPLHLNKLKNLHLQMQKEELKKEGKNWLKVNNEFHRIFLDVCPLTNWTNLIYDKIGSLGQYWYIAFSIPGLLDNGILGHGRIIDAFEKKESELVRNLVESHRIITGQVLRKHLENIEVA
ncbi:MAG: GntR family transcriptional regulator [Thermodesulfobacteriota bacterium]